MTELRISEGDAGGAVLPLWIDGHAYLCVCRQYGLLRNAHSGAPLRRFPICGSGEIERAAESARTALSDAVPVPLQAGVWGGWADLVERFHDHLAALLREESGGTEGAAATEISAAAACLRTREGGGQRCLAVVGPCAGAPLSGLLRLAVPVLRAGGVVIALSPPNAPSVLVALAELSARAGLRPGAFSLLHGDAATWAALRTQPGAAVFAAPA